MWNSECTTLCLTIDRTGMTAVSFNAATTARPGSDCVLHRDRVGPRRHGSPRVGPKSPIEPFVDGAFRLFRCFCMRFESRFGIVPVPMDELSLLDGCSFRAAPTCFPGPGTHKGARTVSRSIMKLSASPLCAPEAAPTPRITSSRGNGLILQQVCSI